MTGSTCSWCHAWNGYDPAHEGPPPLCSECGHRADLSRMDCDCRMCRSPYGTTFVRALRERLMGAGGWTDRRIFGTLSHDATGCVVSEIHGKKCKVQRGGVTLAWPSSRLTDPVHAAHDVAAQIEETLARVLACENTPPSPY